MNLSPFIITALFQLCLGLGWFDGYGYHIFTNKQFKKHRPRNLHSNGITFWKKQNFWRKRRNPENIAENISHGGNSVDKTSPNKRFLQFSPYFPRFSGHEQNKPKLRKPKQKYVTSLNDFYVYSKGSNRNQFVRRNFHRPPYYLFPFQSPLMYLSQRPDMHSQTNSGTSEKHPNFVNSPTKLPEKSVTLISFGDRQVDSPTPKTSLDILEDGFSNSIVSPTEDPSYRKHSTLSKNKVPFTDASFGTEDVKNIRSSGTFNSDKKHKEGFLTDESFGKLMNSPISDPYIHETKPEKSEISDTETSIWGDAPQKNSHEGFFGSFQNEVDSNFGNVRSWNEPEKNVGFLNAKLPIDPKLHLNNKHIHHKPIGFQGHGSKSTNPENGFKTGFSENPGGFKIGFSANSDSFNSGFGKPDGFFAQKEDHGSFDNDGSGCKNIETRKCKADSECSCYGSFFCLKGTCSMMSANKNDIAIDDADEWWGR